MLKKGDISAAAIDHNRKNIGNEMGGQFLTSLPSFCCAAVLWGVTRSDDDYSYYSSTWKVQVCVLSISLLSLTLFVLLV